MYWAAVPEPPAPPIITGLHVDGFFLNDALHHCAKGYNDVVVFSRTDQDTFNKICLYLETDGKAHKIENDTLIKWPTANDLEAIETEFR